MLKRIGCIYCERCDQIEEPLKPYTKLDVHHIIYRSEKPAHEFLHYPLNLILLCRRCHEEMHEKKGNRNELVKERRLDELFGADVLDK